MTRIDLIAIRLGMVVSYALAIYSFVYLYIATESPATEGVANVAFIGMGGMAFLIFASLIRRMAKRD